MVLVAVYLHAALQFKNLVIDADMQESLLTHRLEQFAVVSLTSPYQRREDIDRFVGIFGKNHLQDFLIGIFHHLLTRHVTVCRTGSCKEQADIVVDFRCSTNGGAGILIRGLLFDTDNW